MLREYTSKPCTVLACMIEDAGEVTEVKGKESTFQYKHKGKGAVSTLMVFTAAPDEDGDYLIQPGDYIIQVSKTDIYHCPADVFKMKYSVQGSVIL